MTCATNSFYWLILIVSCEQQQGKSGRVELLGRVTGPSYWAELLTRVTGQSYWPELLDRVTGPSYWPELLARVTGQSYWAELLYQCKLAQTADAEDSASEVNFSRSRLVTRKEQNCRGSCWCGNVSLLCSPQRSPRWTDICRRTKQNFASARKNVITPHILSSKPNSRRFTCTSGISDTNWRSADLKSRKNDIMWQTLLTAVT